MTFGEIRPYYNLLKKYFGTNNEELTLSANCEHFANTEFSMDEKITVQDIQKLLQKHFDKSIPEEVTMTLWLNANVNYDKAYQALEEYIQNNITDYLVEDQLYWNIIEKELLALYALLNQETVSDVNPITIKMGDQEITIDNTLGWLTKFLNNHCFARVLPSITSGKEASEELHRMTGKKKGRKTEREMENVIVNGVACIASDYNMVEQAAPKNLCCFIQEYMCLMRVIEPNDTYITPKWIAVQIRNLRQEYKESPVLHTPEGKPVTFQELVEQSKYSEETLLRYLLNKPEKFTDLE